MDGCRWRTTTTTTTYYIIVILLLLLLLLLLGAAGHFSPGTRVLRFNLVRRHTLELPGWGIGQPEGLYLHKNCRHTSLSQVGLKLAMSVPEQFKTTALKAAATLTGK